MKKIIGLLALSALTLMGCDYKSAHAQNPVSAEVGTPDSPDILIIEQGGAVVQGPVNPNSDMQPNMENITVDETITEEDY